MIYIEAPNTIDLPMDKIGLFIAGTITGTGDWQTEIIKHFKNYDDLVIFNPRRKNFPIDDPAAAEAQITWENIMFKKSRIVSFWFAKETLAPIALYELGSVTMSHPLVAIGVHPEYKRGLDIKIQIKLRRPEIEIVSNLEDLIEQIKILYNMAS